MEGIHPEKDTKDFNFERIKGIHPEKEIEDTEMSEVGEYIQSPDEVRKNKEKNHLHRVKVLFIWTLAFCFIIIGMVVVINLIIPEGCRWLSKDDMMSLKSIFVSGVGGAILGRFGNKFVD